MAKPKAKKSVVILVASDGDGTEQERHQMSVEKYYEGGIQLLDSSAYRKERGIRLVAGEIYGPRGGLDQQFVNRYFEDGALEHNRTIHADGTVTEQKGRRKG